MFDVLMYLFETYIHTEAELRVDQDKLEQDLTDAGFDREDIYNALLWLEKLADYQEGLAEPMQLASDPLSMRIYTPEECERLDASCRGFLLFLEQIQVLNLSLIQHKLLWRNQHCSRCVIMSPAQSAGLNWLFDPGNTVRFLDAHSIRRVTTSVL